jgi:hypothetical protein
LSSNDGVEGAEASIVRNKPFCGNAALDERIFHVGGFVVSFSRVIAADDEVVDFVGLQKFEGSIDAMDEKEVVLTVLELGRTTEQETNMLVGDVSDLGIVSVFSGVFDDEITTQKG